MRNRIYSLLKAAGEPLPSIRIVREILQIQSPAPEAADRLMEGVLGDDSRFVLAEGLWRLQSEETNVASSWATDCAALCMETTDRQNQLRGAIYFHSGFQVEFADSGNSTRNRRDSLSRANSQLEHRALLVWSGKDIQFWNHLLALNRLPKWNGEYIPLRSVAIRIAGRGLGKFGIDDLASMLRVPVPADCSPIIIARFLSECFPLLLERIPPESRTDLAKLRNWIASGRRNVDFSRFGFVPDFLTGLPESPGAYIMKDRSGRVIYVGQSQNLKRRVRSYFAPGALETGKIRKIHEQLHTIDICTARNEVDALLLEMRLIRRLKPTINLQTEIHGRAQRRNPMNLLLLIGSDSAGVVSVYFLFEGRFKGKQSVRLHHSPDSRMRERIRKTYFAKNGSAKSRNPWEMEIVSRWLSRNARRLNWIDVDEAGPYRNVIELLNDYLHDPDQLNKKVYYR